MIDKIEVYKTSDGQLFEDKFLAIEHEYQNTMKSRLRSFVGDYCWDNMTAEDVLGFLTDNIDELRSIINGE